MDPFSRNNHVVRGHPLSAKFDSLLELGVSLFTLYLRLQSVTTDEKRMELNQKCDRLLPLFSRALGSVEILRNDVVEQVLFHIPEECHHLSDKSWESFQQEVPRDSYSKKIDGLVSAVSWMHREMAHLVCFVSAFCCDLFIYILRPCRTL